LAGSPPAPQGAITIAAPNTHGRGTHSALYTRAALRADYSADKERRTQQTFAARQKVRLAKVQAKKALVIQVEAFAATLEDNSDVAMSNLPQLTKVYPKYRAWCSREGHEPLIRSVFARLFAACPGISYEMGKGQRVVRVSRDLNAPLTRPGGTKAR
jgi:hypothetical protein